MFVSNLYFGMRVKTFNLFLKLFRWALTASKAPTAVTKVIGGRGESFRAGKANCRAAVSVCVKWWLSEALLFLLKHSAGDGVQGVVGAEG